ncbi:MAG: hypothetical protein AAB756_02280, partial [Patescibacteria group bacterium]
MSSKKCRVKPTDLQWDCAMRVLKKVRPQQTLHLWNWNNLDITSDMFFRLSRKIRQIILTPQPVYGDKEAQATIKQRIDGTGLIYYVIEIKEVLPFEEQVLCFLHELAHIAVREGEFILPSTWKEDDIEWFVELLAVQYLEACDYYVYSRYL